MKTAPLITFILISLNCMAGFKSGFDKMEVRDMLAICNSFTFIDLYRSDKGILPAGYEKIHTSPTFGMDNKYQVYRSGDVAVIHFRGSTAKELSWLENIYSAMIPASGVMTFSGKKFSYSFAHDTTAAVHSGYALSIGFLHQDLLAQIKDLNGKGIYDIILTGHSQGGALSQMALAYFSNLPAGKFHPSTRFKTYSFASPMIGNRAFADEYHLRFASTQTAFSIVNPADPVPGFPLSYSGNYVEDNLKAILFDRESFSVKKLFTDGTAILLEDYLRKLSKKMGASASGRISKTLGDVKLPPYVNDINYSIAVTPLELYRFPYPRVLKDSSILRNDSLMAVYKRRSDGQFLDERLYRKEGVFYQHKPYNYYVAYLKQYFPDDYEALEHKYLPENL